MWVFLGGAGFYFVCILLSLLIKNVTKDIWSLPSYDTGLPLALASDPCLIIPGSTCACCELTSPSRAPLCLADMVGTLFPRTPQGHRVKFQCPVWWTSQHITVVPSSAFSCPWTPLGFWSKRRVQHNPVHY